MQRLKYTLLISFIFFQLISNAQEADFIEEYKPLSQQQRFDSLLQLHKDLNLINSDVPGYRIRIYFESGNYSKANALLLKDEFESEYPDCKAYVSFNEPYYRVNVGDFRTKIEAIGFLKKILKTYPNAFEVRDMISFTKNEEMKNI